MLDPLLSATLWILEDLVEHNDIWMIHSLVASSPAGDVDKSISLGTSTHCAMRIPNLAFRKPNKIRATQRLPAQARFELRKDMQEVSGKPAVVLLYCGGNGSKLETRAVLHDLYFLLQDVNLLLDTAQCCFE